MTDTRHLLWWFIVSLSAVFTGLMQLYFGAFEFLLANDQTFITMGIGVIYAGCTCLIGWHLIKGTPIPFDNLYKISADLLQFGLIGTVAGILILIIEAFMSGTTISVENLPEIQGTMMKGLGTATTTTLSGLIYSKFLDYQLRVLDDETE